MKNNRDQVQAWIGLSEGGYVNHPDDPGGPTDRGITQATFNAWRRLHGGRIEPVRGVSKAEAEEIITAQYLDPVRFDDLPSGLDYAVADFAVNSGPAQAVKTLQRILSVTNAGIIDDGIMGARTLAAIDGHNIPALIFEYCKARMRFLRGLKKWRTFGKGWTARVMGKYEGAQDDDIGVLDRAAKLARGEANIPAPPMGGTAKAEHVAPGVVSLLKDPVALIPGIAAVATPLASGNGPVQWAAAVAVLALVAVLAWRVLHHAND